MPTDTEFYQVVSTVNASATYMDVFDFTGSTPEDQEHALKRSFRKLARHIHDDVVPPAKKTIAADAYAKLTTYYNEALDAIRDGTVGTVKSTLSFATRAGTHAAVRQLGDWCDMTDCYEANSTLGVRSSRTFIKLARTARDNDLLAAEVSVLQQIRTDGDLSRLGFFPKLVDTFAVQSGAGRLRGNVFELLEGFYNLEQVKQRYRAGVDPLDMAWMWRRVLWALDYAHTQGVIHGAVLPQNIMILPAEHGVVLTDWCYSSVKFDQTYRPLVAVVGRQRDWYPAAVLDKQPPVLALDIALGARSMVDLMGGDPVSGRLPRGVPAEMRAYFVSVIARAKDSSLTVPEAAIAFDNLLVRLGAPYYPRKFRPFSV